MIAYWINLDIRKDRAFNCRRQLEGLDILSIRIPAITREQIGNLENLDVIYQNYYQGIIACRMSHFKAMKSFLNSSEDYCLILEDDFIFSTKFSNFNLAIIQTRMQSMNIGLLQIGYLPKGTSFKQSSKIYLKLIFKVVEFLRTFSEKKTISYTIVEGFLPGSHAYVVNREMAKFLLLNAQSNIGNPFDLWLKDMAKTQNEGLHKLKISRLKNSIVKQNYLFESDLKLK